MNRTKVQIKNQGKYFNLFTYLPKAIAVSMGLEQGSELTFRENKDGSWNMSKEG